MDSSELFARFKKHHDKEDLVEEVIRLFYSSVLSATESVAIDGGCHKGMHTEPLSRCCRNVIAVDANRSMCDYLVEQNRKTGVNNCEIVHAALQENESTSSVTFYISDNFLGRSSLTRLWDVIDKEVKYRPVTVPATTIDKLVEQRYIGHVGFVKLDLEGGEYMALVGGQRMLARDRPVLVMENSIHAAKQGGFSEIDPYEFLTGLGYALYAPNGDVVSPTNLFPFWYVFAFHYDDESHLKKALSDAYEQVCRKAQIF